MTNPSIQENDPIACLLRECSFLIIGTTWLAKKILAPAVVKDIEDCRRALDDSKGNLPSILKALNKFNNSLTLSLMQAKHFILRFLALFFNYYHNLVDSALIGRTIRYLQKSILAIESEDTPCLFEGETYYDAKDNHYSNWTTFWQPQNLEPNTTSPVPTS